MQKFARYIYFLLKHSFIISILCLLVAWIGGADNLIGNLIGTVGFFGLFLTLKLVFIHFIILIVTYIFSKDKPGA
jgi:ABC-type branched-subunit amino acid transport system permease subunit